MTRTRNTGPTWSPEERSGPPTNSMVGTTGPVGVLDSGVGGLTVCRAIRALLPGADLLYYADSAYAPYGELAPSVIRSRSLAIGRHLTGLGARILVAACNTATAAAVELMRAELPVPVVGMEPAVKPAAAATRNGTVGVLATTGTVSSARFAALLDRFAAHIRVLVQPCPGLVEQVERGDLDGPETVELVDRYVNPLVAAGADTLVLGCTHYPFLAPLIQHVAGSNVHLIETGPAVARQLLRRVTGLGLGVARSRPGVSRVFTSGTAPWAREVMTRLWPETVSVQHLALSAGAAAD